MSESLTLDSVGINVKAYRLLEQLLGENPRLEEIMRSSKNQVEALVGVRRWVESALEDRPAARRFRESGHPSREDFEALGWSDIAAIRILDYIDNAGREFEDLNLRSERALSNPIAGPWCALRAFSPNPGWVDPSNAAPPDTAPHRHVGTWGSRDGPIEPRPGAHQIRLGVQGRSAGERLAVLSTERAEHTSLGSQKWELLRSCVPPGPGKRTEGIPPVPGSRPFPHLRSLRFGGDRDLPSLPPGLHLPWSP